MLTFPPKQFEFVVNYQNCQQNKDRQYLKTLLSKFHVNKLYRWMVSEITFVQLCMLLHKIHWSRITVINCTEQIPISDWIKFAKLCETAYPRNEFEMLATINNLWVQNFFFVRFFVPRRLIKHELSNSYVVWYQKHRH